MAPGATHTRRAAVCMFAAAVAGLAGQAWPQSTAVPERVVIVSRERVLREAEVASRLRNAEEEMTRRLQASVDAAKAQLAAEEAELTQLRAELDTETFDARAQDFDRRIRAVRREAQERAAFLQRGFQEARATIVKALPALFEQVRQEAGAALVLNADQVLASGTGLDRTDRVIALLNASGQGPALPKIDLERPLVAPPAPQPENGDGTVQ